MTAELRRDDFLGGRIAVWQPARGYRAGVDPVLLASAVTAKAGDRVLELGCGAGVAALCLLARVPGAEVTGLEIQPFYAGLARRNAGENALSLDVVEGDLAAMPPGLKRQSFEHVMMNPPYFDRARSVPARDGGRETAIGEEAGPEVWITAGARRLRPRGWLTLIHRAERLGDVLDGLRQAGLGSIELRMLHPRKGRDAGLILMRGRKGGRADMRILPAVVMHSGESAGDPDDDYSPQITAILRAAAPMGWGED